MLVRAMCVDYRFRLANEFHGPRFRWLVALSVPRSAEYRGDRLVADFGVEEPLQLSCQKRTALLTYVSVAYALRSCRALASAHPDRILALPGRKPGFLFA